MPPADLESAVCSLAATIAENAPLTIMASKAIVAEVAKTPDRQSPELCETWVTKCMMSEDHVEGRKAFLEKRQPVFVGR